MNLLHDTHIWFLFSFLVFAAIAWKFGKTAVTEQLDKRIEDIRKNIKSAEGLRVEAQEMLAQYQRKHKDAVKVAESIIAAAEKQADDIRKKAESDLEESLKRREKQLRERLQRMEQAAIEEIRQHAATLALTATSHIIAEELDKKANEKLVEESIKALPTNFN